MFNASAQLNVGVAGVESCQAKRDTHVVMQALCTMGHLLQ
ncbi:hypothetical protein HMPREF0091_10005 [Fannyhessea vaginae DSM 15829]|uniref:Uncharacterized protein n=1 Tax=Fannyhessea vaginae DSM 15829 TaxID=525256 RepID=F1T4X0_9ACTN|nr:hypothetical protein HMPREF0091_10005 [Fannyhessea vaginae DSM 15829]